MPGQVWGWLSPLGPGSSCSGHLSEPPHTRRAALHQIVAKGPCMGLRSEQGQRAGHCVRRGLRHVTATKPSPTV